VKELVANTEKKLLRALLVRQDFDSGATCLHYVTKSKDLELFQAVFHGNPEAFDISDNQKQSVLNYASKFSGKEINQWVEDNYLQNVALKKTATQSSTIDDNSIVGTEEEGQSDDNESCLEDDLVGNFIVNSASESSSEDETEDEM
jgi:hypothetical protein